ncbi:MAG: hypothetical protein NZ772_09725 [Cyanobacteria bacterium]|nr:hypothetical protein [Cyanobacteriota bacterium]MDW8201765.1 hypothetical protein [Cyanobacteriota bacterium SKYGB_h_bin112]
MPITPSLWQRFCGVWMGALVAEALLEQCSRSAACRYQPLSPGFWSVHQDAAVTIAKSLLQASTPPESRRSASLIHPTTLVPFILLYGDNPLALTAAIQHWSDSHDRPLADQVIMLHSVGLILHNSSPIHRILSADVAYPWPDYDHPALRQTLRTVAALYQNGASLTAAQQALAYLPLVYRAYGLALFCFVTTPQDCRLTLQRAIGCTDQPLTTIGAGLLVGAYNGELGLPIEWRAAQLGAYDERVRPVVTQLFARWCGVYDGRSLPAMDYDAIAVSVPGAIRSQR